MTFQALTLASLGLIALACVLTSDIERCIIFITILIA
jgi:hypothetical protein